MIGLLECLLADEFNETIKEMLENDTQLGE